MLKESALALLRDWEIRIAAISWLLQRCEQDGSEVRNYQELLRGFRHGNERVKLKHPQQGIYRPVGCLYPISISTSLRDPYGDGPRGGDGVLRYRYKGSPAVGPDGHSRTGDRQGLLTNVDNPSNRGLRRLMELRWPLIHFRAVASGEYLVVAPVVLLDEDPLAQNFGVGMGSELGAYAGLSANRLRENAALPPPWVLDRSAYRFGARRRVREGAFRERVLIAYKGRCAACSVSAPPLLDAVRIVGASALRAGCEPRPAGCYDLRNALSLCKLHHAAYDHCCMGITPGYRIQWNGDPRTASVGRNLSARSHLHLPARSSNCPSPRFLAVRYEQFRETGVGPERR